MSSLRKRFRVVVDGGTPIDVVTSARDLVVAQDLDDEQLGGFAVVYHALTRQGVDVGTFDDFIDRLDEFEVLDEPTVNGADDMDPTSAVDSASSP